MSIYMVQHSFAKPEWEQEWNDWYAGNLPVLMSVPGFLTGQRFKSPDGNPPRYMAMYTVREPGVFQSETYIAKGGNGVNSQRFRPAYQVWIRNLLEGIAQAPEVKPGEALLVVDSPERVGPHVDLPLAWLETTGFHKSTPWRGLAVVTAAQAERVRNDPRVIVYEPITAQLGPVC